MVYHILYIYLQLVVARFYISDLDKQPPSEHHSARNSLQRKLSYHILDKRLPTTVRNYCISSSLSGLDSYTWGTSMVPVGSPYHIKDKHWNQAELVCCNIHTDVCILA
jgi:hypothetical protein